MGGILSRSPTPPSQQVEFDKPWRIMPWGKNHDLEQKLRDFKLPHPKVRFVRILLIGDIGAGKSSFINSVNNVFQKRVTCDALTANANNGKSFTKRYKSYYIEGKDGSHLAFVFNDIMGFQENCLHTHDIIKALRGCLQEGYDFEKVSSESEGNFGYKSNPSSEDQVYCLVNVMAADKVSMMNKGVIAKMNKIHEAASELNMRQVIVMTRPDLMCPLVKEDIRKIYTSMKIKEKMEVCSNELGITMNHIFPVKNYHQEIDNNDDMDLLILKALDQIVHIAADGLKNQSFRFGSNPDSSSLFEKNTDVSRKVEEK